MSTFKILFALLCAITLMNGTAVNAAAPSSSAAIEVLPELTQARLEKLFPSPYVVGERDDINALWPLHREEVTGVNLIGYIYESIEYSSIPGFMGIPYNLLVVIDPTGKFLDVRVLFHREPMFIAGVGEAVMHDFVAQYQGLSLMQNLRFNSNQGQRSKSDNNNVYLDGISGATASIRILNQTLLSSALKVARAKLDFGSAKDPSKIAKIDNDLYHQLTWQEMLDAGLIQRSVLTREQAVDLFGRRATDDADLGISQHYIDIYVANLAIPSVGRNLLPAKAWSFLNDNLEPGDQAIIAINDGHKSFIHDQTLRAGISDRLLLRQEKLPIELRDLDLAERLELGDDASQLQVPDSLKSAQWMAYRILATSGVDIAIPLDFTLTVLHGEETPYREVQKNDHPFSLNIPDHYYFVPDKNAGSWQPMWQERQLEIAILLFALTLLTWVLAKPQRLTQRPKIYGFFRYGFLLFTLCYIGWYAQGQLSIVNITGAIQSYMLAGNINFFLYDPITTLLWIFVIATFFIWGRGTFCGWLCPFGALQELVAKVISLTKIRPIKPSDKLDAFLKRIKYGILAVIIICAFFYPHLADKFVEIEPFKTAITFYFSRHWPFVLWAVFLVVLSGFVYKGYCRYLCPLGAAMAVGGKLRQWKWLPRRQECGSPCQLCKHSCEYNAITRQGEIVYDECFQCLDCVVIHDNETLCVPLIIKNRKRRRLKTQALAIRP